MMNVFFAVIKLASLYLFQMPGQYLNNPQIHLKKMVAQEMEAE